MGEFANLPCDIIICVSLYLNGYDILCLYLSGNRNINHALIYLKEITFSIDDENDDVIKRCWKKNLLYPSIISNFKFINKLSITFAHFKNNRGINTMAPTLNLPATLTYLNIDLINITEEFITRLPIGLKYLLLNYDTNITNSCIIYLPQYLEYLSLERNTNISKAVYKIFLNP